MNTSDRLRKQSRACKSRSETVEGLTQRVYVDHSGSVYQITTLSVLTMTSQLMKSSITDDLHINKSSFMQYIVKELLFLVPDSCSTPRSPRASLHVVVESQT